MYIFYKELALEEGFAVAELERNSRIVGGREVSTCAGIQLFKSVHAAGKEIKCWKCNCLADRWISERHENEMSRPVLNLYGTKLKRRRVKGTSRYYMEPKLVLMTRDHIIPKSLGGVDDVANLRPGCTICNGNRESKMDEADTEFMLAHPELISAERLKKAQQAAVRNAAQIVKYAQAQEEKQRDQVQAQDRNVVMVRAADDRSGDRLDRVFHQDPHGLLEEGRRGVLHDVEASGLPGSEVGQGAVMLTKRELGNVHVGFSQAQIDIWHSMIGKRVWKKTSKQTPKPFKSGLQINTITGVVQHDHSEQLAFTFAEDESKVECFRCRLVEEA